MTKIFCPTEDCKHNSQGLCKQDEIELSTAEVAIQGSYYEFLKCDAWEVNMPPFTKEEKQKVKELKDEILP